MKKHLTFIAILAVAIVVALAGIASAQKIGFINMRAILHDSEAGKKASVEFKKEVEKKKADIARKEEELKKLKDDLEKQKSVLTPEAYRDKETGYRPSSAITSGWSRTPTRRSPRRSRSSPRR